MISHPEADAATLYAPISSREVHDPDLVKLVLNNDGKALYFSRAPIPYHHDNKDAPYLGHIEIYSYCRSLLEKLPLLSYSSLEVIEKLEQLRLLQSGIAIDCMETSQSL